MKNDEVKTAILLPELLQILVPEEYLAHFELASVRNLPNFWEIELHENVGNIPELLLGKDVVSDGFCNAISIMSHCFFIKEGLFGNSSSTMERAR